MTRKLAWTDEAWDDYIYWQGQDKKTLKRINKLIEAIDSNIHLSTALDRNKIDISEISVRHRARCREKPMVKPGHYSNKFPTHTHHR
jgi:hypothetical protein